MSYGWDDIYDYDYEDSLEYMKQEVIDKMLEDY